jgi:hypothetical protein
MLAQNSNLIERNSMIQRMDFIGLGQANGFEVWGRRLMDTMSTALTWTGCPPCISNR